MIIVSFIFKKKYTKLYSTRQINKLIINNMENYIELNTLGKGSNGCVVKVKSLETNEVLLRFYFVDLCNEETFFKCNRRRRNEKND